MNDEKQKMMMVGLFVRNVFLSFFLFSTHSCEKRSIKRFPFGTWQPLSFSFCATFSNETLTTIDELLLLLLPDNKTVTRNFFGPWTCSLWRWIHTPVLWRSVKMDFFSKPNPFPTDSFNFIEKNDDHAFAVAISTLLFMLISSDHPNDYHFCSEMSFLASSEWPAFSAKIADFNQRRKKLVSFHSPVVSLLLSTNIPTEREREKESRRKWTFFPVFEWQE